MNRYQHDIILDEEKPVFQTSSKKVPACIQQQGYRAWKASSDDFKPTESVTGYVVLSGDCYYNAYLPARTVIGAVYSAGNIISPQVDWRNAHLLPDVPPVLHAPIVRVLGDMPQVVPFDDPSSRINSLLKDSEFLKELEKNWDDEGANAISELAWNNMAFFLRTYYSEILASGQQLPNPSIDPCIDGSIDLLWQTSKGSLLINFRANKNEAGYYGDNNSDLNSIKGLIDVLKPKSFLISWMKEYL